jgi:hypothetical protein
MCLTVSGKEKGCYDVGVVRGGIPTMELVHQVKMPMMAASIPSPKVGKEC